MIKRLALRNLRKFLGSRDYELIPRWEIASNPLVMHLRSIFTLYGIECVIDVGGNLGQYATLLRTRVGFVGSIVSFEPVSRYFKVLKELSENDSNWHVVHSALGSKAGHKEITLTRSPGLASFLDPRHDRVEGFWKDGETIGSELVEVTTLDAALAAQGHDCSKTGTYLKLDTQGFDLEVLAGSPISISHIRGLQTEASVRAIYRGMPDYRTTISTIEEAGFDLSGMFPVTLDKSGRLIEFDCVAVNSRFADKL